MTENPEHVEQAKTPGWVISAIVILAIVSIAGVGLAWNESARMQDLQTAMGGQIKTAQQDSEAKIAALWTRSRSRPMLQPPRCKSIWAW